MGIAGSLGGFAAQAPGAFFGRRGVRQDDMKDGREAGCLSPVKVSKK